MGLLFIYCNCECIYIGFLMKENVLEKSLNSTLEKPAHPEKCKMSVSDAYIDFNAAN